MAEPAVSWSVGSSDSRAIRVLLTLAAGFAFGVLFGYMLSTVALVIVDPFGGVLWIFVLLFLAFLIKASAVRWYHTHSDSRFPRSLIESVYWQGMVILTVLVGGVIVFAGLHYWAWYFSMSRWVYWSIIFVAIGLFWLARFLSSVGEIDPESRTLTVSSHPDLSHPVEPPTRTINLDTLTQIRDWSIGEFTIVRLAYQRGTTELFTPRLVAMPTSVARSAIALFEEGVAQEVEGTIDPLMRRIHIGGALGLLGLGVVIGGLVYVGTGFVVLALYFVGFFGFLGLILLFLASRS